MWSLSCGGLDWVHKHSQCVLAIDKKKGLLKRLIRPGQAAHIKTWWGNRPLQAELKFCLLDMERRAEKVKAEWQKGQIRSNDQIWGTLAEIRMDKYRLCQLQLHMPSSVWWGSLKRLCPPYLRGSSCCVGSAGNSQKLTTVVFLFKQKPFLLSLSPCWVIV